MIRKRQYYPIYFIILVLFALYWAKPVLALKGDVEAASKAWPMIHQGAMLIDVRSSQEYAQGHIEGAVNIPYDQLDALIDAIGSDKQRPVVVYCRSGNRSGKAMADLQAKGYSRVHNATGLEALKATKP